MFVGVSFPRVCVDSEKPPSSGSGLISSVKVDTSVCFSGCQCSYYLMGTVTWVKMIIVSVSDAFGCEGQQICFTRDQARKTLN